MFKTKDKNKYHVKNAVILHIFPRMLNRSLPCFIMPIRDTYRQMFVGLLK